MAHVWDLARPKAAMCGAEHSTEVRSLLGTEVLLLTNEDIPTYSAFSPEEVLHLTEAEDKELIFTLQPTSGSTGKPKLLVRTRWNWCQREGSSDTTMLLGSLASPAPRSWLWLNIFSGGKTAESSLESLVEDCQTVHPTQVSAPPLVWDMICEKVNSGRMASTADAEGHINWTKNLFGPNCRAITNTGATLSPHTRRAMKLIFPGVVHDGYGSSETGGIAIDGNLLEGVEVQLRDVPELVLHCGAEVNWVMPYSSLRCSNTLPVYSLLQLAGNSKPFHFVSTIAVADPGPCETKATEPNMEYGYGASKWAAEEILNRSVREGETEVVIYRPGHLLPVSNDVPTPFNKDDFLSLMIQGCIFARGFPSCDHITTEWTCVRTTAELIVESILRRREKKNLPTEFNLFTNKATPYKYLFEGIITEGYEMEELTPEVWMRRISSPESPLYSLCHLLSHGISGSHFSTTHTHSNVNYITQTNWPTVTPTSARNWVKYLKANGIIPPPKAM